MRRSHTGKALRDYDARWASAAMRVEEGRPLQHVCRRRAPSARAGRRRDPHRQRARAQPEVARASTSRAASSAWSPACRARASRTLAFDILFNEGQRRYLESLNAYARSIVQPAGRPEVDAVYGIPPTVAIEQRLSRGGRKSTVARPPRSGTSCACCTSSWACSTACNDGAPVRPQSAESIAAQLLRDHKGQHIGLLAPLVVEPQGRLHRPRQVGQGARLHAPARGRRVPASRPACRASTASRSTRSSCRSATSSSTPANEAELRELLAQALELGKGVMHVLAPLDGLSGAMLAGAPTRHASARSRCSRPSAPARSAAPAIPSSTRACSRYNSKHGWCPDCVGTGLELTREQRKAYDDTVRDDDDKGREQTFPPRGRGRRRGRRGRAPTAAARG